MAAALEVLAGLGAEIEEVRLPPLDDYYACCLIIVMAEGFALHRRDLAERAGEYGEICRSRLSMGAFIDEGAVAAARRIRPMLTAAIEAALERVDVLVTAGGLGPAPPVAGMPKHGLFMSPYLGAPFNVSGHPAAAVRCGFSGGGLPLGMQIAGRLFDEATVLRVAHAYERATPWAGRRPELDE